MLQVHHLDVNQATSAWTWLTITKDQSMNELQYTNYIEVKHHLPSSIEG
jgi:hypothetical protein